MFTAIEKARLVELREKVKAGVELTAEEKVELKKLEEAEEKAK